MKIKEHIRRVKEIVMETFEADLKKKCLKDLMEITIFEERRSTARL